MVNRAVDLERFETIGRGVANATVRNGMARDIVDDEFRPSAGLLKRAGTVPSQYAPVLTSKEGGGHNGSTKELSGIIAIAPTLTEGARRLNFSDRRPPSPSRLADGERFPAHAAREKRTGQVNVRFTPTERIRPERASVR